MKENGFKNCWRLVLLEMLLLLGGSLSAAYFMNKFGLSENVLEVILQFLTVIPILIGIVLLKRTYPHEKASSMLSIKSFDITMLLFLTFLPIAAQFFASYALLPVNYILSSVFGEYDSGLLAPESISDFLLIVLSACIIAPILEELLFRGVIMRLLEPYGFLTASVTASVAFAMLHFNPTGFFVIMLLGFVLACVRYVSGSVLACIFFHAYSNFYSVLSLVFENELAFLEKEILVLSIIFAVAFLPLFAAFVKIYPKRENYVPTAKKLGFSLSLFVCIGVFAAFSAYTLIK